MFTISLNLTFSTKNAVGDFELFRIYIRDNGTFLHILLHNIVLLHILFYNTLLHYLIFKKINNKAITSPNNSDPIILSIFTRIFS